MLAPQRRPVMIVGYGDIFLPIFPGNTQDRPGRDDGSGVVDRLHGMAGPGPEQGLLVSGPDGVGLGLAAKLVDGGVNHVRSHQQLAGGGPIDIGAAQAATLSEDLGIPLSGPAAFLQRGPGAAFRIHLVVEPVLENLEGVFPHVGEHGLGIAPDTFHLAHDAPQAPEFLRIVIKLEYGHGIPYYCPVVVPVGPCPDNRSVVGPSRWGLIPSLSSP